MSAAGKAPRNSKGLSRSQARLAAVQALYQMDLAETDLAAVIDQFKAHRLGSEADDGTAGTGAEVDPEHFAGVLKGVVRRQREIDPMIDQQLAQGWRLTRIDSILRAILRAGAFELMELDRRAAARDHQRVHRRGPRLLRGRRAPGGERRARRPRPQAAARRPARAGMTRRCARRCGQLSRQHLRLRHHELEGGKRRQSAEPKVRWSNGDGRQGRTTARRGGDHPPAGAAGAGRAGCARARGRLRADHAGARHRAGPQDRPGGRRRALPRRRCAGGHRLEGAGGERLRPRRQGRPAARLPDGAVVSRGARLPTGWRASPPACRPHRRASAAICSAATPTGGRAR